MGNDEFEIAGSKGSTANFVIKWDGAKSAASMNVITLSRKLDAKSLKGKTLGEYTTSDQETLIAVFDCRGMEPTKWYPVGPFIVEAESGAKYDEVNLEDPDGWMEATEQGDMAAIENLTFDFRVVK